MRKPDKHFWHRHFKIGLESVKIDLCSGSLSTKHNTWKGCVTERIRILHTGCWQSKPTKDSAWIRRFADSGNYAAMLNNLTGHYLRLAQIFWQKHCIIPIYYRSPQCKYRFQLLQFLQKVKIGTNKIKANVSSQLMVIPRKRNLQTFGKWKGRWFKTNTLKWTA